MFVGRKASQLISMMVLMVFDMESFTEADPLPTPNGVNFLGIGYNILSGNPEGGDLRTGGVDPGLLVSRKIFQMTFSENQLSSDRKFSIPDQVYFVPRQSAYTSTSKKTFYGTSSYASKLSAQVEVTGSYKGVFAKVKFAASTRYERIKKDTSSRGYVYFSTETITNLGQARLLLENAQSEQYRLDRGFVAAACSLPNAYDEAVYMKFIDEWGTHIVIEVNLGIRQGKNYKEERSAFVNYASTNMSGSVSVSGSYKGFGASLSVDMESFNSAMESETEFGSAYSQYSVGNNELNEPIGIKLMGMHQIFEENFWGGLNNYIESKRCTRDFQRAAVGDNILKTLEDYANYKSIQNSTDPLIKIPLTWPEGTYGLPRPITGCPNKEFDWNWGFRFHDTEDTDSENSWSAPLHLSGQIRRVNNMRHEFCIKTVTTVNQDAKWAWQPGSYCIYKYGDCPKGFESGWIYWDDENSDNINSYGGTMPSGEYGDNTKINFCCRNDGVTTKPIYLPKDNSFFLFPRFEHCQAVDGMRVTREFFSWDTADTTAWVSNTDAQSAVHPYYGKVTTGGTFIKLYFCYYEPL